MLHSVKQYIAYILAEVVRVALHIRQQRVEVDERRCIELIESSRALAFERIEQQQHIRIDRDLRLRAVCGLLGVGRRGEMRRVVEDRALIGFSEFGERTVLLVDDVPGMDIASTAA